MSNQLAVSATFSILMMAVWVLFGAESSRVPLDAAGVGFTADHALSTEVAAPSMRWSLPKLPIGH